ncbi:MAG TPA: HAMP domain-containing sensor histidine kinase [Gemmatimonadota bacterium]|nr:HAMP domain-containing sensor histidine kinase [Gemmatimonadota bacterium]
MNEFLPAAIAFFALGANLIGTTCLLLLAPRSRALRWFAVFELDIMIWLALQGWAYAIGEATPGVRVAFGVSVHMLPALFLVDALVDIHDVGRRSIFGILALAAVTAPLTVAAIQDSPTGNYAPAALAWQIAGWGLASILHVRREAPEALQHGARKKTRLVVLGFLVVVVPLSIILGFLTDDSFFIYVMPLITVVVQIALFIGVTQLRFYDIEARSARRGELATDAAALQRQAMVGELAASFAHEVRNPLTGVRSLAQRLSEDELDDPTRRRYSEVIVREVGRVERIVADLLAVSRRGVTRPPDSGPIDLAPLFDDLRILLAPRADRSDVELRVPATALRVSASRETLAQVLLNLLLNAIEHSPAGGRVELLAEGIDASAAIAVRDQGPGVPPGDRERIFAPLYSGRGGSGLGLAVVRRIADESRWGIAVADAPGGGAEFRVRVPLASPAHARGPVR